MRKSLQITIDSRSSCTDILQNHRYVLVHLPNYGDKLEYLLFMLRKLYSFAAGDCGVDNADSLQNQEILLPGHLISTFVKEKFEETLANIRLGLLKEMRMDFVKVSLLIFLYFVPKQVSNAITLLFLSRLHVQI